MLLPPATFSIRDRYRRGDNKTINSMKNYFAYNLLES